MELEGKVIEIINEYGYILGEDSNLYFFSKADFILFEELILNKKVVFKPFEENGFRSALLIEYTKETSQEE